MKAKPIKYRVSHGYNINEREAVAEMCSERGAIARCVQLVFHTTDTVLAAGAALRFPAVFSAVFWVALAPRAHRTRTVS